MATKKKTDAPQVIEHDVEDEATTDEVQVSEVAQEDDSLAELDVTLSNGAELTLHVIKDQNDWAYEAVEAMTEMNYPVLVNAILTKTSKMKLKMAGARVRDFEMITEKVSAAIGAIKAELDAKNKK